MAWYDIAVFIYPELIDELKGNTFYDIKKDNNVRSKVI